MTTRARYVLCALTAAVGALNLAVGLGVASGCLTSGIPWTVTVLLGLILLASSAVNAIHARGAP